MGGHIVDEELRWQIKSNYRSITNSSLIPLLRQLSGGLSPGNQIWLVEKCIEEPLALKYPRGIEYEK